MTAHDPKYIFVTGGVVSSLGKGISAASIGALLESRGLDVNILKLDPYLNVDPGTMNPFQHGEVFVTDDGAETDLDLGHYERFLGKNLSKQNSKPAGQIYQHVLEKERNGEYLGDTVQVVPHITDEIKKTIVEAAKNHDILICEVGGTIGDIESLPFIESIRQMRCDFGFKNTLFIHVSYVPYIKSAMELKTKPTQHSVKEALSQGIQPDILILRAEKPVPADKKDKIALYCNVPKKNVISCYDKQSIYQVPIVLHDEGIDEIIIEHLNIWARKPELSKWQWIEDRFLHPKREITIAIVGKYVDLTESYKSIHEALYHAGFEHFTKICCKYIDSEKINKNNVAEVLNEANGILVPGGFGERGFLGKLLAIKYARENNIPFLGICLGLQIAVIEYLRNVASIKDAGSQEFDEKCENMAIHMMHTQRHINKKGGTMRLGAHPCEIKDKNSKAFAIYGKDKITERHRHRFEVNNKFIPTLEKYGMKVSGVCPGEELVEIVEIPVHKFFIACQFHPEFLSRPQKPHPLFANFIKASFEK